MSEKYSEYFNIKTNFFPQATEQLIESGQVRWQDFFPHDTFLNLLEKLHGTLSGQEKRSLWVEGPYGVGKSHAALTIKSLLEADDASFRAYFQDHNVDKNTRYRDLCQKLLTDRNTRRVIVAYRISSAGIYSDDDLILRIEQSVEDALEKHNIQNRGEDTKKSTFLSWVSDSGNKAWFEDKVKKDGSFEYSVDEIIEILETSGDKDKVYNVMKKIVELMRREKMIALVPDIKGTCDWLKKITDENNITILFIWDEFTEYFLHNQNNLTGFQTLAEISLSSPFYFMIITHESTALVKDEKQRNKILDRFAGRSSIRLDIPENIAFKLLAQAMALTDDPVLRRRWEGYKNDICDDSESARQKVVADTRLGINDEGLRDIVPIHPYAALVLKNVSVVFNSNARGLFDFVSSKDVTGAKGFRWFIETYGPLDRPNLLTVDMLWDFFCGKNRNELNNNVRRVLEAYDLAKPDKLLPDEQRVLKTTLILDALHSQVSGVDLLCPTRENIDLAFDGVFDHNKAAMIADGLVEKNILFKRTIKNGQDEFTSANMGGVDIEPTIEKLKATTRTESLIEKGDLLSVVKIDSAIDPRFVRRAAGPAGFDRAMRELEDRDAPNRFKVLVAFSLNDDEDNDVKRKIASALSDSQNELIYIRVTTPMSADRFDRYIESMAYSTYYMGNDNVRAKSYADEANGRINDWKDEISRGTFSLYTNENKNGMYMNTLDDLNDRLRAIDRRTYPYGVEHYTLTDAMFNKGQYALGAECGIKEETRSLFKSANPRTSLENALGGVWRIPDYWEDLSKQSLAIVKIKQKVDEIVDAGFKQDGRVSMSDIYSELQESPFGLMSNNVTAFVLGFVLKEYATKAYFWTDGSLSEEMSVDKMKKMIAAAIKQDEAPARNFKEEYIVTMSEGMRAFLDFTSESFGIPENQCRTLEDAKSRVRIKVQTLAFPLWCLKYVLDDATLKTPRATLEDIIESYCSIIGASDDKAGAAVAERIGGTVKDNDELAEDFRALLTSENCKRGMQKYIESCHSELSEIAARIGDGGAYLEEVRRKFSSSDANWLWNKDTADGRIADVTLDYRIIEESNQSMSYKCTTLDDTVAGWKDKISNIHMSYFSLRQNTDAGLKEFLSQLYSLKTNGQISNKEAFYDILKRNRDAFDSFYNNQPAYFKRIYSYLVEDLDDEDIESFFNTIPKDQFMRPGDEYYNFLQSKLVEYKRTLKKTRLRALWNEKTGTKSPADWSDKYTTPILCMFDDKERSNAKEMFEVFSLDACPDSRIENVISYLEHADFYEKLASREERDACFRSRIIGDYATLLKDTDFVRNDLREHIPDKVYDWMYNGAVQNRIKVLADDKYKSDGKKEVRSIIDKMSTEELKSYLNSLIEDNLAVGIEILKSQ